MLKAMINRHIERFGNYVKEELRREIAEHEVELEQERTRPDSRPDYVIEIEQGIATMQKRLAAIG